MAEHGRAAVARQRRTNSGWWCTGALLIGVNLAAGVLIRTVAQGRRPDDLQPNELGVMAASGLVFLGAAAWWWGENRRLRRRAQLGVVAHVESPPAPATPARPVGLPVKRPVELVVQRPVERPVPPTIERPGRAFGRASGRTHGRSASVAWRERDDGAPDDGRGLPHAARARRRARRSHRGSRRGAQHLPVPARGVGGRGSGEHGARQPVHEIGVTDRRRYCAGQITVRSSSA